MTPAPIPVPDDVEALRAALSQERAALAAEQLARREAEARASGAEAMVAHLKLLIARYKHDRFGASSERGRKLLDQLELQLEEVEAAATEDELAARGGGDQRADPVARRPARRKPVRGPLPAHLPRERVVVPSPTECPCCGGALSKLGEDVTETLEVVPRRWKVIQTVRERFSCRSCEHVAQPPAPFHPIARGRAGPGLLAMVLEAKFGQHLAPAAEPPERDLRHRRRRSHGDGVDGPRRHRCARVRAVESCAKGAVRDEHYHDRSRYRQGRLPRAWGR